MLRVGLTGELGSGKSTVARILAEMGAIVLSSDEMGRRMMQPGEAVYQAIVDRFGPPVLLPDGSLNRPALAALAFDPEHPRVAELNAIVHPAVIAEQERQIAAIGAAQPHAVVIVESALIFTAHGAGEEPWRTRFDHIVVVTAPEEVKIERFLQRSVRDQDLSPEQQGHLRRDAEARLRAQRFAGPLPPGSAIVENSGSLAELRQRCAELFHELQAQA